MRKRWLIAFAVVGSVVFIAVLRAGLPSMKRYVKMEKM
jgi:hypothetical protein